MKLIQEPHSNRQYLVQEIKFHHQYAADFCRLKTIILLFLGFICICIKSFTIAFAVWYIIFCDKCKTKLLSWVEYLWTIDDHFSYFEYSLMPFIFRRLELWLVGSEKPLSHSDVLIIIYWLFRTVVHSMHIEYIIIRWPCKFSTIGKFYLIT